MAYMVVNSRYNPFTYDELVKPLVDYTTAYEKQEALADAYATAAANLDSLSPDLDSAEYQNYNNWKTELKAASDLLATSGLTPEVRSTLKSLGTRFNTELNPTLEKMKTRAELVKEQREAQAKNPDLIFNVDYSTAPLASISPSSTYSSYNLKNILTEVGNDVYNRMSAGESVPSANEYLTRYSAGLKDADKIARVNNAISSGMSLGSSTYQQKEFDNYIKKVQATRSRSSSGGSGTYATSGTAVPAPDGTAINITFNKKVGAYQLNNKQGKPVTISREESESDEDFMNRVYDAYFGGKYEVQGLFGLPAQTVTTTTETAMGPMETTQVLTNKGWATVPAGATNRDVFKQITGIDFPEFAAEETLTPLAGSRNFLKNVENDNYIKKNVKLVGASRSSGDLMLNDVITDQEILNKINRLYNMGIEVAVTGYVDNKGNVAGYKIDVPESVTAALDQSFIPLFR